jgi:UDP-N-acetylglucosamine--N-acetylmuramyl-(pentapeptide) pyrophosphoryl-undecaprenol N-acetylglucosamine transferase
MKFSFFKALRKIVKLNPLAVVGMGGYIAVPVLFAAKILHKKTFIHEQNVVPGKANILLNKIADKTFINFRSSEKYFKKKTLFSHTILLEKISCQYQKKRYCENLNLKAGFLRF